MSKQWRQDHEFVDCAFQIGKRYRTMIAKRLVSKTVINSAKFPKLPQNCQRNQITFCKCQNMVPYHLDNI